MQKIYDYRTLRFYTQHVFIQPDGTALTVIDDQTVHVFKGWVGAESMWIVPA